MEKKKLATAILASSFFAFGGVVHASTAAFSDSFEGASLDPYWTIVSSVGGLTKLADYSLSTEKAKSGSQSLKITFPAGGIPGIYLFHYFSSPVHGTFSVWSYDTLAPVMGGLMVDDATASWASLGRSYINWSNPTQYYVANLPDPSKNPSSIIGSPTQGWHHYEITVTDSGSSYRFDGVNLGPASPLSNANRVDLGVLIPNNVNNHGGYTAYFDDFSFKPVPVPAAVWLLGSGLAGLIGTRLKRKNS